jgi:hypothetical protein
MSAYCLPSCDPLANDCGANSECVWANSTFSCVDAGAEAPAGAPCGIANDCGSGLLCMTSESLAGCVADSCCTPFCSVMAGAAACQLLDPGYVCEPFFMQAPSGYEDLGVCMLAP